MVTKIEGGVEFTLEEACVLERNHTMQIGHVGIKAALSMQIGSAQNSTLYERRRTNMIPQDPRLALSDQSVGIIVETFSRPLNDSNSSIPFVEKEQLTAIVTQCDQLLQESAHN